MAANTSVFLDGPALAAPVGVISQLDSPPNYKTASVAGPAISFVLATLLVSMRIYTKKAVVRSVDLADCRFQDFSGQIGSTESRLTCVTDSILLAFVRPITRLSPVCPH